MRVWLGVARRSSLPSAGGPRPRFSAHQQIAAWRGAPNSLPRSVYLPRVFDAPDESVACIVDEHIYVVFLCAFPKFFVCIRAGGV